MRLVHTARGIIAMIHRLVDRLLVYGFLDSLTHEELTEYGTHTALGVRM